MNPETPTTPEVKRGPGRPRKEPEIAPNPAAPAPTHPIASLGDLYAAIDTAPHEWLPSLLVKIVRVSLKAKVWSDVENLILSVRGFAKK